MISKFSFIIILCIFRINSELFGEDTAQKEHVDVGVGGDDLEQNSTLPVDDVLQFRRDEYTGGYKDNKESIFVHLWPNGRIPVRTNTSFAKRVHDELHLRKSINEVDQFLSNATCTRLVEKTNSDDDFIEFTDTKSGCFVETIGNSKGRQIVNLGDSTCWKRGVIMHEIMHKLGFVHEHQRNDRDNHVHVFMKRIAERDRDQYRTAHELNLAMRFEGKYDHDSIMHYPSEYQGKEVIRCKKYDLRCSMSLGNRHVPTAEDVEKINKLYRCFPSTKMNDEVNIKENENETDVVTESPGVTTFVVIGSALCLLVLLIIVVLFVMCKLVKKRKKKISVDTEQLAEQFPMIPMPKTHEKHVREAEENKEEKMQITDLTTIKSIKAHLQYICENVRQVWGILLNETSLGKCFVEPEIVEEELGKDGKRRIKETGKTVHNYEELFQSTNFGDRIVIEGDPGMGKTTYVNKLALDWTRTEDHNENSRFLLSNFSVVFLIPLRSLNGGKQSTFAEAANVQLHNCGSWLSSQFEKYADQCLLILDGFDEYDGSCHEINEIIRAKLFPCLKVIITTRPSHIRRLEIKNQWLTITGLTTPEKRERFLIKQGWNNLKERDMVIDILSGFGTLWHTPLYLAMLCVLYKANMVTNFEPQQPNCFYVLVKLFTEHIISRYVNEKGLSLDDEVEERLKSLIQQQAIRQFLGNNPWLNKLTKRTLPDSIIEDNLSVELMNLAGQIGFFIVQQEQSPISGRHVETVSFVHQMFLEYYASIAFKQIFNESVNKKKLVDEIMRNLGLTSPFSYFLAAECCSFKEMIINAQRCRLTLHRPDCGIIDVYRFSWLPYINISKDIFKNIPTHVVKLEFHCNLKSIKSFWDINYVEELCSIRCPAEIEIYRAFLSFHGLELDSVLSTLIRLKLDECELGQMKLPPDTVYPNLTTLEYKSTTSSGKSEMELLKHFPNLRTLHLSVSVTDDTVALFCELVGKMNQLEALVLNHCFKTVLHVIHLAKTIENTTFKTLKALEIIDTIIDSFTETDSASAILFRAIFKCDQLEKLTLYECQLKPQSPLILENILRENSANLNNLKKLWLYPSIIQNCNNLDVRGRMRFHTKSTIEPKDLDNWKSEVMCILQHCEIKTGL